MSTAFFIVLDNKAPGFETFVNGKSLAKDSEGLDKIAEALGIRLLDEFVSYSPEEARAMMEEMGGDPVEIEAIKLPDQTWYDPEEGLTWVRQMITHLQAAPSAVKHPEGVLEDLQEYQAVLEQAKAVGAKWNLQVDF